MVEFEKATKETEEKLQARLQAYDDAIKKLSTKAKQNE